MAQRKEKFEVESDIAELEQRLEEAEETLRAIREGEVDALVVDGPQGEVIYTLTSADYPYRLMIDEMNEGAVSVSPDAFILYSNRNFAGILGLTESNMSGVPVFRLHCSGNARAVCRRLAKGTRAGRSA